MFEELEHVCSEAGGSTVRQAATHLRGGDKWGGGSTVDSVVGYWWNSQNQLHHIAELLTQVQMKVSNISRLFHLASFPTVVSSAKVFHQQSPGSYLALLAVFLQHSPALLPLLLLLLLLLLLNAASCNQKITSSAVSMACPALIDWATAPIQCPISINATLPSSSAPPLSHPIS